MKRIFKYSVPISKDGKWFIELPLDAIVVSVQVQNGVPVMWVLFNRVEIFTKVHNFEWYATGEDIPQEKVYVGTVQVHDEVYHLFENI